MSASIRFLNSLPVGPPGFTAIFRQTFLNRLIGKSLANFRRLFVDDQSRRTGGNKEAAPKLGIDIRKARLGHARYIG